MSGKLADVSQRTLDMTKMVDSLEVNQALLKEDDDLLRQMFSQVFRHHHPEVANKVDVIFSLAQVGLVFVYAWWVQDVVFLTP
jgi:hypothetical protein